MNIEPYHTDAKLTAGLVDLIEYCQNEEAHLGIKMIEQPDVFEIEHHYQENGGNFWVATDKKRVVGSIGLLKVGQETAVLKKLFTYPEYRGEPHRLGRHLFQTLLDYTCAQTDLKKLVLDTPMGEKRSHFFYEKQGFKLISREKLTVDYEFPDRNSLIYERSLKD
ncbi:MAG TPA: GNAT family N-acetyltransferase [Lactobacillus sp.]|nr:GNAT family N-acetyltransferase [Lactobacillus sp.]